VPFDSFDWDALVEDAQYGQWKEETFNRLKTEFEAEKK